MEIVVGTESGGESLDDGEVLFLVQGELPESFGDVFALPEAAGGVSYTPNSPPVIQPVDPQASGGSPITVTLVGEDPDGDTVFFGNPVSDRPEVQVVLNGNALHLTPDRGFSGTAHITVSAYDGPSFLQDWRGRSDEVRFDFTVGANAIYGTSFADLDRDGIQDEGEGGLDGIKLFLDDNQNGSGTPVNRSPIPMLTGTTLSPGSRLIRRTPWWKCRLPGRGSREATRPNPSPLPALARLQRGVDFGNVWNTAPVAVNDDYAARRECPSVVGVTSGILSNDTDGENDMLQARLVDQSSNGTVTLNGDGSFAYTPADGFYGTDTFTYRAYDGEFFPALQSCRSKSDVSSPSKA